MYLKEIIYSTEWLSVQYTLIDLYPELREDIEVYKKVFIELNKIKPKKSNIILEMDRHWEDGEETNYANTYGHDPTLPDDLITKGIAIEFRPWEEWLEYEIGMDAKEEWNEIEMICHAIMEMTFDGLTQTEIKKNQKEMLGDLLRIKDEYFNEKKIDK